MQFIRYLLAATALLASPLAAQDDAAFPIKVVVDAPSSAPLPAVATPQVPAATTRFADLRIDDGAAPLRIPTEHFAGRSAFQDFAMSPDGSQLIIIREVESITQIVVMDTQTLDVKREIPLGKGQGLDFVKWAGNGKLIISISQAWSYYGWPTRISRLYVRDLSDNSQFHLLVNKNILWGGDVVYAPDDGSYALIAVQQSMSKTPAVYRYDLHAQTEPLRVVKPKRGVWSWYADDDGVVRMGMGWLSKRLRVYYRKDGSEKFELIGKLKAGEDASRYWSVVQIVSGSDQGYVLEEGENGRMGVRLFDYALGKPVETYYENPDWDVEELWLNPDGSPRAALYTDDRNQIEWFDEEDDREYESLKKALKMEQVRFVTSSTDNERILIWAGSEADPGALYIYTPESKELTLLASYRPDLDFQQLVKPQPIKYRARDGLEIPSYLTLPRGREAKNLPLIILPHGGPYGIRDKLSYNDEVQLLANRGYAVLQPNFRGSGGYGDDFFEAGTGEIGRGMQDDLDDAMDWAVAEGIADGSRVCVVGASYGGYAALWAVLRNPDRYRCAASWAGVTDWDKMLRYDRKFLKGKAGRKWRDRVTGDEDFDIDLVSPTEYARTLSRPLLLAHGTSDTNVPISQYEAFEKASRDAPVKPTTLEIEGEGHGFSKPENEKKWYDTLEAFLAEHNPADPIELAVESSPATGSDEGDEPENLDTGKQR